MARAAPDGPIEVHFYRHGVILPFVLRQLLASFDRLVNTIGWVHAEMAAQAERAINKSLTLHNWLIG